MITVFESISRFWLTPLLQTINPIHVVIEIENIPDFNEHNNAGIFSSPNDQHFEMLGGQMRHVEFKSFYLRRAFRDFQQRVNNEAYTEALRQKIRERNLDSDFPNDGRQWISISINGGIYPASRQENLSTADYLVPLRLEYIL